MTEDEIFRELTAHDLEIFKIYHPGDLENENLVLIAIKDCYLSDYMLLQTIYREEDGLPDHNKSHFLIFDDIKLERGDRVRIYTKRGEDCEEEGQNTGAKYYVVYWGLDAPVWKEHGSEVMLVQQGDGYGKLFD